VQDLQMIEKRHIGSLDGLRGFAAAIVVLSHLDTFVPAIGHLPMLKLGSLGVAIFFALSGFLMAYLYGSRPLTRETGASYLVSRFARIYPVYFVAICLSAWLSSLPELNYPDKMVGLTEVTRHVVMLGSRGVFWSIPPEIQFYGFFLVLWLLFREPQKYQAIALGVAVFLAADAILGFPGPGFLLISKLPYFLLGAVAGRMKSTQTDTHPNIFMDIAALALLMFFVTINALGILTYEHFWGLHTALAAAVIVYLFACEGPISTYIFGSAPLRFLGSVSFSLYLFHVPVLFLANKWLSGLLSPSWIVAIALVTVVLVSWLSFLIIEGPTRRYIVSNWNIRFRSFAAGSTAKPT
jgi:peptidoglycan/LPS O-acetylase OafA/YrhL